MRRQTHTIIYQDESRLFYVALSSLVLMLCLYMYFVSASVMHVVMRKEVDTHIAEASTAISELESTYIEMQHNVSSDIATHKGFVSADKKIFIDRSDDTLVLRN